MGAAGLGEHDDGLGNPDPRVRIPEPIVVFAKPGCPHCARAKALLAEHRLAYTELVQDRKLNSAALRAITGAATWPQVYSGGRRIGGADELAAWLASEH
jgi:glutaredoxin-like protein